jgi:hypothetical protein
MQVTIGPLECRLNDLVDFVEPKVGADVETPPDWRPRVLEIDADPVSDLVRSPWSPTARSTILDH